MKLRHFFVFIFGLLNSYLAVASDEILRRPVQLQSEAILIDALSVTLQHAIMTSSSYQGSNPNLKRLAKAEVRKRQQDLQRLHQLAKTKTPTPKTPVSTNKNDQVYQQSILMNHARLIELAEFGSSLKLSGPTRRFLKTLSGDVSSEFSMLVNLG
ncbi:hypothetical protein [Chitinibacter sp. S2-10]|uniref:hypothetical protein n=1 Tax=Chitinibacter sp. S2-10 TaxID=3373597 RepID=UPI0039772ABE